MGVFGKSNKTGSCGEERVVDEFSFHVPGGRTRQRKYSADFVTVRGLRMDQTSALKAKRLNESVLRQVTKVAVEETHRNNKINNRKSDGILLDRIARVELVKSCEVTTAQHNAHFHPAVRQTVSMYEDENSSSHKCQKLLNLYAAKFSSIKVILFPEEEWARNASTVQWTIKVHRWLKRFCTITEKCGTRVSSTGGKIIVNTDGTVSIHGKFKREIDPDFKLHLSTKITRQDFQNGYAMIGSLKQGNTKTYDGMQLTHFVAIPRYQ